MAFNYSSIMFCDSLLFAWDLLFLIYQAIRQGTEAVSYSLTGTEWSLFYILGGSGVYRKKTKNAFLWNYFPLEFNFCLQIHVQLIYWRIFCYWKQLCIFQDVVIAIKFCKWEWLFTRMMHFFNLKIRLMC